jgi:predicted HNH restriction endonuclease
MKIDNKLVPLAYDLSIQVYKNEIKLSEAVRELSAKNQMNENSARDYINNFKYLLEGRQFTRTLNQYSMNYFLNRIYEDFGKEGINNAIQALEKHVDYYEGKQNAKMRGMRKLIQEFSELSLALNKDEKEQNDIIKYLISNKKSKKEILNRLLKRKTPKTERIIAQTESFKRDNNSIAEIKYLRGFKCEICGKSIKKRDGSFYIEAAHIKPKYKEGEETLSNIILLCPNHHKEFDLGYREILSQSDQEIVFLLRACWEIL